MHVNRFGQINYNFFSDGAFCVPERHDNDRSRLMLVMVVCYGYEWHRLAVVTKAMYKQAKEQVRNKSYDLLSIIDELVEDTTDFFQLWSEENPYDDNMIIPTKYTWEWVVTEQRYIQELKYKALEEKYRQLEARALKTKERKQLIDEYRQEKQSAIEERQKLKEVKKHRKKTKVRTPKGYVYVLEVVGHEGLYKIGRTKNPDNRLKTFNVKLPFPVQYECVIKTDDMYDLESTLHNKFRDKRQRGSEFFKLSLEDVEYIKHLELTQPQQSANGRNEGDDEI